jgi:phosphatidate cytidylyltransferase
VDRAEGDLAPGGERRSTGIMGSELALRIGSAAVLVPLALGSAYVGGAVFLAFWAAAASIILWEWTALVGESSRTRVVGIGVAAFFLAAALFWLDASPAALGLLALGAIGGAALSVRARAGWILAGGVYAAAMLAAPALLRSDAEWGFLALVLVFAVVWTTDVMAYFAGRVLGGPKLWPAVSPKKTWSGAIGGLLAGTLVGAGVAVLGGLDRLGFVAVVCALLSLAAQAGDLLESGLKRHFGAKNASELIPGHGGLMDRLDGFVAAAVLAAVLGLLRAGLASAGRGLLVW